MTKPASAENYKLITSYESVRRRLLGLAGDERLDKPLAYWALPSDRRLPLALLDRTLSELLARGFDDISATPGIGQKKMGAMIKLLLRAAKDETPDVPFGISELVEEHSGGPSDQSDPGDYFDPELVSESQWARWKETAERHQLHNQPLGQLARSLENLPTVIWRTPLSFYLPLGLAEIRGLKTHGEKRVAAVLQVFHMVHQTLHAVPHNGPLAVRLTPRLIQTVEDWLEGVCEGEGLPDEADVRSHLALPLLRQTKLDAGATVHNLCEGRLGVRGAPQSVRNQSKRMGVTRARVYQLLDEAADAMAVRWPEGRYWLRSLCEKFSRASAPPDRRLLDAVRDLYFPEKQQQEKQRQDELKTA